MYKIRHMKMIKQAILFLIKAYQDYISKFTPKSCRYYPSCSEFAVWQFKFNGFFSALFAVIFRILRCNQLFKGGIDYPVISKNFDSFFMFNQNLESHIAFWFVPYKKNKFYVIKNLDFQKEK
ncbi:MAG: membrane protein insertion efficiency factor YidD [Campylobacter sp.]|uniref:membrane protein insertion efficiency factor YidD n=2 Tax=Campylobacter TaxID=194 RepID=UPI0028E9E3BF|nr:membrane protein insertion efficiency factor YidD [uncultured Campylobacter sp.]